MPSRARLAVLGLLLLTAATVAGCLGDDGAGTQSSSGAADGTGPAAQEPLPPGCSADRLATSHHPGGEPVEDPETPTPRPCLMRTGNDSEEPTLGIDADGNVFMFPALSEDLYVGGQPGGQPVEPVGVSRSTDGGETWERVFPNTGGQSTHVGTLDPFMHLDVTTGRAFFDDLITVNCSYFSWTDDTGESWDHSVAGCAETDHQNVFTGPPATSVTVGYPNVVYRCAINAVAVAGASTSTTCQKSLDGGRTWLPPQGEPAFVTRPGESGHDDSPYCDGASGHGWADAEGAVYLPKGWCGEPWLAISHDETLTWDRVKVADNGMRVDGGTQSHEAGVATDTAGNVYYTWVARDRLPYLAISRDGGETWSDPMMIGPPNLTQASLPQIMAGGEGRVAVSYMGSTNAPEAPEETCDDEGDCQRADYSNATWNGYLTVTASALDDEPLLHSAPVNDPEDPLIVGYCGAIRCGQVLDFIDVEIGPDGTPWAPYVDGCLPDACEPRDGEGDAGVVGRLVGGPSLWGPDDPNGRYPDAGS